MKEVVSSTKITNVFTGKTELNEEMKYDKNGNIIRIKDGDLEIKNTYDSHNNLINMTINDEYWAKFEYDKYDYLTHYMNSNGYEEFYKHGKLIKTSGGNKNEIKKEN